MQIYHYDPTTGIYLGTSEAAPDPLDAGQHLIPAHATTEAPSDAAEAQVACWSGEAWELAEDHRGAEFWLPEDDWDSLARTMTDVGPMPDENLATPPDKPAEVQAEDARATIFAALDQLDATAMRPTRSIVTAQLAGNTPDPNDVSRLTDIEASAAALRTELAGL